MRFTVARRNSQHYGIAGALLIGVVGFVIVSAPLTRAQQSMVAATVCQPSSSVTIAQPVGDSTVTTSTVALTGSAIQANQIEVYVDDVFDHSVPINLGETAFSDTVHLSQGTHTIKVVAVNICSGPNGSATSVVTYEPPVSGGDEEGNNPPEKETADPTPTSESISSESDILPALPFIPQEAKKVFEAVGQWLNIAATYEAPATSRLTLVRATTIAVGSWLLAFGVATTVIQWLGSTLPVFSDMPNTRRMRIIAWLIRGFGLVLVLGGLFL